MTVTLESESFISTVVCRSETSLFSATASGPSQRTAERSDCMAGLDKTLWQKEKKQACKKQELEKRRRRSDLEKTSLLESAELESSTDADSAESDNSPEQSEEQPSTSTSNPIRAKRRNKMFMSPRLVSALDRTLLSDRAATMILFESSRAIGENPQELPVSKSTINRQRKKLRKLTATSIKENFTADNPLTIHWDGKLMPDIIGKEKVETLPILVSGMGKKKLLGIPKLTNGTGKAIAHAVFHELQDWHVEDSVRVMCFDTTASNTGRSAGACVILEQLLGRHLLHFACRHHIFEIMLGSVFQECFGSSGAPEIGLFKRFQVQWENICKDNFEDVMTDDFILSELGDIREDVIRFCNLQLQQSHPRDDYQEFLDIMLIFLRSESCHGKKFRAPGPMHQARWMAKAIYSIKVWLFRSQFKLTTTELKGLRDINIFIAKVYIKAWFSAPLAPQAPRNDLNLLQSLYSYPQPQIKAATLRKIAGHLR